MSPTSRRSEYSNRFRPIRHQALTAAPFMSGDTAAYAALIGHREALFNQLLLRHDVHGAVVNRRKPLCERRRR